MSAMKDVTLVAIDGTGNDTEKYHWIFRWCMSNFSFNNVLHLSCSDDKESLAGVTRVPIGKLSYPNYSRFCVVELSKWIRSDYCMIIHTDGFIINPQLWEDGFLNFDYIGAPWYHLGNTPNTVGNGGFCIRSRRFLEFSASFKDYDGSVNEDLFLCAVKYWEATNFGLKFADPDTAARFSYENYSAKYPSLVNSFGFHQRGNLAAAMEVVKKNISNADKNITQYPSFKGWFI